MLCWLDVRGTGSSGGIATDEYTAAERDDLVRVIDWLATQPWSLGTVGMFGTSYGGFNSLQVALEQPPALKAIVPIFASDDRYADDVHYYGGALKQLDVVDYPTYMVAMNALPPVPALWGDGWRDEWQRRLEQNEPWFLTWLAHQHRDDYWRYGSARGDIERIRAATMIVGGWADGYTNIALRSFPRMQAPTRLLLGPWAHGSPETCRPGPNIDFGAEMLRWFDRWLKGIDNGVDREPPIVVYQQRSTAPDPLRSEVRGDWRFEPTWPPERLRPTALRLADAPPPGRPATATPRGAWRRRGPRGSRAPPGCRGGNPRTSAPTKRTRSPTPGSRSRDLEILGHPRLRVRSRRPADRVRLGQDHRRVSRRRLLARRARHDEPGAPRQRRGEPPLEPGRADRARPGARGGRVDVRGGPPDPPRSGRRGLAERMATPVCGHVAVRPRRRRAGVAGARRAAARSRGPVPAPPTVLSTHRPHREAVDRWQIEHDLARDAGGGRRLRRHRRTQARSRSATKVWWAFDRGPGVARPTEGEFEMRAPRRRAARLTVRRDRPRDVPGPDRPPRHEDGDERWHRPWERRSPATCSR